MRILLKADGHGQQIPDRYLFHIFTDIVCSDGFHFFLKMQKNLIICPKQSVLYGKSYTHGRKCLGCRK